MELARRNVRFSARSRVCNWNSVLSLGALRVERRRRRRRQTELPKIERAGQEAYVRHDESTDGVSEGLEEVIGDLTTLPPFPVPPESRMGLAFGRLTTFAAARVLRHQRAAPRWLSRCDGIVATYLVHRRCAATTFHRAIIDARGLVRFWADMHACTHGREAAVA